MRKQTRDRLVSIIKRNQLVYKVARYLYEKYKGLSSRKSKENLYSAKHYLNVVIIVADCLRASQLSYRGYPRQTTPFLDTFGCKFRAISASCWTHSAVASLLTGLYPHNHNAIMGGKIKDFYHPENLCTIGKQVVTLPEILFLSGYRVYFGTAISVASYPFKGRRLPAIREPPGNADNLMTDLTNWISKNSGPFFAYAHLADLHEPLHPPDDFRDFFGKVADLPKIDKWDFGEPEEQQGARFEEYKENRILLYDNTLRYVDHVIEKFYAALKDMGLADSTVLIVTADHGEEFWEHGAVEAENFYNPRGWYGLGHGHSVFNEVIEIPLLISVPGVSDGQSSPIDRIVDIMFTVFDLLKIKHMVNSKRYLRRQSRCLVSMVDIMPTVLDLLKVKHRLKFDGQSILSKQKSKRPLLSEASVYGYEKKSLIIGKFKLIYSQDDGVAWVFDLEKDPQELHPITDQGVVSMFVDKLSEIQRRDKTRRIRETVKEKNLTRL
jgi:arylsulfatase A-like enzyme